MGIEWTITFVGAEARLGPLPVELDADQGLIGEGRERRVEVHAIEDDTQGHALRASSVVRVRIVGDGDTEGHAISIKLPGPEQAEAFRRRLAAGALAGTLLFGASAWALAQGQASTGSTSGAAPQAQVAPAQPAAPAAPAANVAGNVAAPRPRGVNDDVGLTGLRMPAAPPKATLGTDHDTPRHDPRFGKPEPR